MSHKYEMLTRVNSGEIIRIFTSGGVFFKKMKIKRGLKKKR